MTPVGVVLVVLLLLLLAGAFPMWSYNAHWSYYPSGGIGLILLLIVILLVFGRI